MSERLWLFVLIAIGTSPCLGAESYPNKPVRVIVNYASGGAADIGARVIAQQLGAQLDRTFVVENRPGASGTIGTGFVAKSAPDGYTLMIADTSFAIVPSLFKSLPYDAARDFVPITQLIAIPNVLVVHPSLNVKTLKEFVALARANPRKLDYGSAGVGSLSNLAPELFNVAAKVNISHVPYSGGAGETITALLGGHIQMLITTVPSVVAHVKSGKMRALAVTTDGKRAPSMPDVPSMAEAGVHRMTVYGWIGLAGPAGIPKDIVSKVHAETMKALTAPMVKERFAALDGEIVGSSPEEFSAHIRSELRRWNEVIKTAGITIE